MSIELFLGVLLAAILIALVVVSVAQRRQRDEQGRMRAEEARHRKEEKARLRAEGRRKGRRPDPNVEAEKRAAAAQQAAPEPAGARPARRPAAAEEGRIRSEAQLRLQEAERTQRDAEQRLVAEKESRERALQDAHQRLQQIEAPAAEVERREPAMNLNTVTFEQLREQGLSVTQATRVLAHRERLGGYRSVDDLDDVPGFQSGFLTELKQRATV